MSDSPSPDWTPSESKPYRMLADLLLRFPVRIAGSPAERGAQEALAEALTALGGEASWHPFAWPPNLYGSLALHFGTAAIGGALSRRAPLLSLALQGTAAVSLLLQLTRRGLVLHRLLGSRESQNVLVTFRPAGEHGAPVRKRLVLLAHADSAYTGFIFRPEVLRWSLRPPPPALGFLQKQLRLPVISMFALAALSGARAAGVDGRWMDVANGLLTIPAALAAAINLEVVLRNQAVPGAADNMSGCVSVVELARRLAPALPPGSELVAVITGSEESGTGGATRLVDHMESTWGKAETTVLAIDTMSNGELVCLEEGELWRMPVPERIARAIEATGEEPGMPKVRQHPVPTGATDALPFLSRGYEAAGLTSIDPEIRAPRHYHHPTDTAENVSPEELARSIDFAERLCLRLLSEQA